MADWWWVSTKSFTGAVKIDSLGMIVETAPILSKFREQHISSLKKWIRKLDGVCERLGKQEEVEKILNEYQIDAKN